MKEFLIMRRDLSACLVFKFTQSEMFVSNVCVQSSLSEDKILKPFPIAIFKKIFLNPFPSYLFCWIETDAVIMQSHQKLKYRLGCKLFFFSQVYTYIEKINLLESSSNIPIRHLITQHF